MLRQNSLIVFEGLDATGKSTQIEMLKVAVGDAYRTYWTHQPSGQGLLTKMLYLMTEELIMTDMCRQFLHLASHAEQYQNHIIPELKDGNPVVMDRCWISTVAYGYYAGKWKDYMSLDAMIRLVQVPTQGILPDIVFFFMNPHQNDPHNTSLLIDGYNKLIDYVEEMDIPISIVPAGTMSEQHEFVLAALKERGLFA